MEQNICVLRDSDSFRKELEELPKLALFVFDCMSDSSGQSSMKRRRISSSPLIDDSNMGAVEPFGDLDLLESTTVAQTVTSDGLNDDADTLGGGNIVR